MKKNTNVDEFLEYCDKKEADLLAIEDYFRNKTVDQIDQLKIDLLRCKGGIERWNLFFRIYSISGIRINSDGFNGNKHS